MSVTVRVRSNHGPFNRALDKIERQPSPEMTTKLDAVLDSGFKAVQAETHVITGALKASLRKKSSVNRAAKTWRGKITAGGGPVDYAIYEQRRGVGGAEGPSDARGDHNFMRPLDATELAMLWTILGGLK